MLHFFSNEGFPNPDFFELVFNLLGFNFLAFFLFNLLMLPIWHCPGCSQGVITKIFQPWMGHQLEGGGGAPHRGYQSSSQEDAAREAHNILTWCWCSANRWRFLVFCPNFVSSDNSYKELCIITSSSGPALVHLNFKSILGQGVMLQYVLPVEENIQKLVHIFYTSRTWIPPYAKVDKSFSIKTHRQRYHKVTYWASCGTKENIILLSSYLGQV